ncbi:hypothetical protein K502DRAFT_345553 [Neoconidiobolus thromboides FSU 785]|nr:hypothetical protein K502DRAFT_345553 [Neoconidiobolus thromboides FSU 785]
MEAINGLSIPFSNDEIAIKLEVPVEKVLETFEQGAHSQIEKYIFIALDNSGSMCGEPFKVAKEGILQLCQQSYSQVNGISLFVHNHECKEYHYQSGELFGPFEAVISGLSAGGGNTFKLVFDQMGKKIQALGPNPKSVSILFFSDGADCYEYTDKLINDPNSSMNQFKNLVQNQSDLVVDFHSVGFTQYHDAILLGKMAEIGHVDGSFQYVKEAQDIEKPLEILSEVMLLNRIQFYITFNSNSEVIDVKPNSLNEALVLIKKELDNEGMWLSIKSNDKNSGKVGFQKLCPIKLSPLEYSKIDSASYILAQCDIYEIHIKKLADKVLKSNIEPLSKEEIEVVITQLDGLEQKVKLLYGNIGSLSGIQRKVARPRVLVTKRLIDGLKEGIAKVKTSTLSNDMIASWQALASQNVLLLGNKARKAISKRSINNINPIEENEHKIEQTVENIDFEQLRSETNSKILDETTCPLTRSNFIEALEEGDCIGIGLQVKRSEACVFDSSLLQIINVGPTFMTCVGFMDILSFKIIQDEQEQMKLHGGFGGQAENGSVTTGLANETINAVMPLYLNEQHWKIASRRSKTMLSWTATLSITGGLGNEIKIIPFLVLSKCLDIIFQQPTEHNLFIFKLVLDTCMTIYNTSYTTSIKDEILEKYNNFSASPLNRMSDSIPNQSLFLAKVFCAIQAGDIRYDDFVQKFDSFSYFMSEEVVRRKITKVDFEGLKLDNYLDLFSIDKTSVVNDKMNKWKEEYNDRMQNLSKEGQIHYKEMFGKQLEEKKNEQNNINININEKNTNSNNDIDIPLPHYEYDINNIKFNKEALKFIDKIENETQSGLKYILTKMNQLTLNPTVVNSNNFMDEIKNIINSSNSEEFTYNTLSSEQKFSFFNQNYLNKSNESRRKLIEDNINIQTLNSDIGASKSYIKHLVESAVKKEYSTERSLYIKSLGDVEGFKLGLQFLNTQELDEAAGLLKFSVKFHSVKKFHQMITALQSKLPELESLSMDQIVELQLSKLEMMVSGEYKEIALFDDKFGTDIDPHHGLSYKIWTPSDRNIYRFFKVYEKLEKEKQVKVLNRFKRIITAKEDYLDRRAKSDKLI